MIKTVIFDVDGTLVDTVDMHAEAWQRALKEYGRWRRQSGWLVSRLNGKDLAP